MLNQWIIFCVVLAIIAVIAYQAGKMSIKRPNKDTPKDNQSVRISKICSSKDSSLERELIVLKNHCLDDALEFFNKNVGRLPALRRMLDLYQVERKFPDLSYFRLGPNMFDKIFLDWIIIHDPVQGDLVGHGITTGIAWNQKKETLPGGWQGAVRTSYLHSHVEIKKTDTLIGLFIFVEDGFRQQGWANNIILEMRSIAQEKGLQALIIPLRPPTRYKKEYAEMLMDEFAKLERDDGHPQDHWIRLHTRLGAKILKASEISHQHALPLNDFHDQFSKADLPDSGDALIEKNGEWYKVYVDRERDFVLINQGCVWVQHRL